MWRAHRLLLLLLSCLFALALTYGEYRDFIIDRREFVKIYSLAQGEMDLHREILPEEDLIYRPNKPFLALDQSADGTTKGRGWYRELDTVLEEARQQRWDWPGMRVLNCTWKGYPAQQNFVGWRMQAQELPCLKDVCFLSVKESPRFEELVWNFTHSIHIHHLYHYWYYSEDPLMVCRDVGLLRHEYTPDYAHVINSTSPYKKAHSIYCSGGPNVRVVCDSETHGYSLDQWTKED